ncbi:MAG: hypothetical protein RBQ75_07585 [Bacteroidales bacterium]|jgi:hypothetical protein|nr:hypothetical protein [Bacteroidales bacterium]MDD2592978.1 hypothetical protein [Bacteroidales bacterium]MDY0401540.1 hypothetical protein [Bacteroidales bacterium]
MKKVLKFFITFMLCINSVNVFAQYIEKQIDLYHLSFENKNLTTILDSIILHEKKCNYYDCNLLFSFDVQKFEDNYISIVIESNNSIDLLLGLDPYGFFYYKNHMFIVDGDSLEELFSICGQKVSFKYLEEDLDYIIEQNTKRKYDKNTIIELYFIIDDSFSQWSYIYINGEFIFEGKSSFCN